jgi:hypothetical protein
MQMGRLPEDDLDDVNRRVLLALCARDAGCGTADVPLRSIATVTLGGDTEAAVRALVSLDLQGYVRTDVMGWRRGKVTVKGRQRAARLRGHAPSTDGPHRT